MELFLKQPVHITDKIGEIYQIENGVEWRIAHFSHLPKDEGRNYRSDTIVLNGERWCLQIYPNGCYSTIDHVNLCLVRISTGKPISIELSLALKTANGNKDLERKSTAVFDNFHCFYISSRFVSKSELARRGTELMPSNVLTVICKMKFLASTENPSIVSLRRDYKKVLLEGTNHDIRIKVGNEEFRAHQDILKARSRVFESMLSHDMSEKNSGIIDVPDFDTEIMEQFLLYMYCGEVDKIDESNMFELYCIAEKYEVEDLKIEASEFIQKSLSPTNICDAIQFALIHNDSYIETYATEYFIKNVQDILCTKQWESFIKGNFPVANDLLIKSLDNK